MTEVIIKSMKLERIERPGGDTIVAYFSLHLAGIAISDCPLYHRRGAGFFIAPPQGRRNPVAITFLDKALRRKATVAARAAYEAMVADEPADAGLRRVLSAEHEACAAAGL